MIQFPSIAQFKDVLQDQRRQNLADRLETIEFIGTVKLHGTNAAFVSDGKTSHCQSRNRILTLENDNLGFCKFANENANVLELLAKKAFELVEPVHGIDGKIALFGEWCGGNIQKHVGLEQLPRMFVIFDALFVSNSERKEHWLTHDVVAKILVEPHDDQKIYNIYSFPTFSIAVDFANPGQVQPELNQKTLDVEKECPVTAAFGYKDQVGEGIVWRQKVYGDREPLRFKTKGDKHSGRGVNKNPVLIVPAKLTSISDFCKHCLHDARLNQGLEYLTEQGLDHSMQHLGAFLSWINRDIVKEESNTLQANNLEWKDVAKVIGEKAKKWYQQVKE